MMSYWGNFAHSQDGNPNEGDSVPKWAPFSSNDMQNILLQAGQLNMEQYKKEVCDFWDKLGYSF
jgi:hypothetical protein